MLILVVITTYDDQQLILFINSWIYVGYQGQIAPTLEYNVDDFSRVMNINVVGMFIVMQSIAKKMAEENDSTKKYAIVNTASVAALRGTPAMVAYSSSKAAVITMTVSAAKDLAPHNIRVNAISPGKPFPFRREQVVFFFQN